MNSRLLLACGIFGLSLTGIQNTMPAHAAINRSINSVISQDQFVPGNEGSIFHVSLSLSGGDADSGQPTEIVVTSYQPVKTRHDVRDAVNGSLPQTIDTVVVDISSLWDPITGRVNLAVPIEINTRTTNALQMSATGLYPITIGLQQNKTVVSQLVTFVERLGTKITTPNTQDDLRVALIGSLDGDVTRQNDSSTLISNSDREATAQTIATLEDLSTTPITLAIRPEFIEGLDRSTLEDGDLLARLQSAQSLNILSNTYVDVNQALTDQSESIFTDQLRLGEDTLRQLLPTFKTNREIWFQQTPLFGGGAQTLRNLGFRNIVMLRKASQETKGADANHPPTSLAELQLPDGGVIDAAFVDVNLSAALTRGSQNPRGGAYLVAQQILAELKMLGAELTADNFSTRDHGVILSTDSGMLPSTAMLTALKATLNANSAITFVSLDDLLSTMTHEIKDGSRLTLDLAQDADVPPISHQLFAQTQERVDAYASMLTPGDAQAAQWKDLLSVMSARTLSNTQRQSYVDAIWLQTFLLGEAISTPTSTTFTLGGRQSSLRISLRNDNDYDVRVRVRLTSSKLAFTAAEQVVLLPSGMTTSIEVPVVAKSNGSFPVSLQLFSPSGNVTIGRSITSTARVNALAGLGQLVTGLALLLLIIWWIFHLRRASRRRLNLTHSA
ncbi:MAG: hypothetical protein WCG40_03220 [Actinomycetes bacterium]